MSLCNHKLTHYKVFVPSVTHSQARMRMHLLRAVQDAPSLGGVIITELIVHFCSLREHESTREHLLQLTSAMSSCGVVARLSPGALVPGSCNKVPAYTFQSFHPCCHRYL